MTVKAASLARQAAAARQESWVTPENKAWALCVALDVGPSGLTGVTPLNPASAYLCEKWGHDLVPVLAVGPGGQWSAASLKLLVPHSPLGLCNPKGRIGTFQAPQTVESKDTKTVRKG